MSHKIKALLEHGVKKGIYPGAVLFVGLSGTPIMHYSVGYTQKIPHHIPIKTDTIFDLASLTKPLATSVAIMKLVNDKLISLDMPIAEILPAPKDKEKITIKMLLNHSSGLPDWRPYYIRLMNYPLRVRKALIRDWILKEELIFSPGKNTLYSDLGFILLEWVIELVLGSDMKAFVEDLYSLISLKKTFLSYPKQKIRKEEFAATELCPWRKRLIQGEVHDENAFSLGGYSGHAGLFSTAEDVFTLCNMLLEHYHGRRNNLFSQEVIKEFFKRHNKRWALGWDTPSEKSSSGRYFSKNSVGHLGFTGTSIWIDLEKEAVIVFLTNRIHPSRKNEKIKLFRPILHDQIMKEIFSAS